MTDITVLTVLGVRPEFVKAAALTHAIRERSANAAPSIREIIVHTGQHYDPLMSDVFFTELALPAPDHHLEVGSGTHGAQTGEILKRLEPLLEDLHPDVVVVYGDTNSTLGGALAAAKLHLPVAHIEAGLRSFNTAMPEEINRKLTDHMSSLLFCPSDVAVGNLAAEGIKDGVFMTGDVQLDVVRRAGHDPVRAADVQRRLSIRSGEYVVVTIHRAENTDDPLRLQRLAAALNGVAALGMDVIVPIHPRTRRLLSGQPFAPEVQIIEPLGFLDMLALMEHAAVGLTDSGGLQKELYWLATPCITLRDETEWVETLDTGWNRLVGTDPDLIVRSVERALEGVPPDRPDLYGDGRAAGAIIDVLAGWHASKGGGG